MVLSLEQEIKLRFSCLCRRVLDTGPVSICVYVCTCVYAYRKVFWGAFLP